MTESTLGAILQYIWVPIVTGMFWLWSRVFGVDARTSLLEQAQGHHEQQRAEERKLRDRERLETHAQIETHHETVMTKLDGLETRIKNGH